jgi:ketosteroid isomerase-like protein
MDVIGFWTRSWISDDKTAVRKLLAPDVEVEWNLDAPVDDEELLAVQHRIAAFADTVTVAGETIADDGAALVYDLKAPFGTARMVEFLAIADGRITEVRQVYDVTLTDRYFPGLYAN